MAMRDIGLKKDKEPVRAAAAVMNETVLSSEDMPELADFNVGDKIEMKMKATVSEISRPGMQDNVIKEDEPGEYKLKFVACEIINTSEARKEAESMGFDMKSYKRIQSKRGRSIQERSIPFR